MSEPAGGTLPESFCTDCGAVLDDLERSTPPYSKCFDCAGVVGP